MRTERCNLSGQECVHLPLACGKCNNCAKAHACSTHHCVSTPLGTCKATGGREGIMMHMLTALVWCTCGHSPVNNASRLAFRWPARQCSPAGSRTLHACGTRNRCAKAHTCTQQHCISNPLCTCMSMSNFMRIYIHIFTWAKATGEGRGS